MDSKKWRSMLNEGVLVVEAVDFLNKSNDDSRSNKIQITLERKIGGKTAWYRLQTDGWVRRYFDPGKGYGLLLKSFKVTGSPKYKMSGDEHYVDYPIILTYIPNEYSGEVDWDKSEYIEKAKGILMIWTDRTQADGQAIEKFINRQISKKTYQP